MVRALVDLPVRSRFAMIRLVLVLLVTPVTAWATTQTFANFCPASGLTLNGTAATNTPNGNCTLRLTDAISGLEAGSGWLPTTLPANASFSTTFSFRVNNNGADGFTFAVQAVGSSALGSDGGDLGYGGIIKSVAVEFDTYDNGTGGGFNDSNANHIGVDVNGSMVSVAQVASPLQISSGNLYYAWIDFNGATKTLEVRIASTSSRPATPLLSTVVDVAAALGTTSAWVGFTGGTGYATAQVQEIGSWSFTNTFAPVPIPTVSEWALGALVLALAVAATLALRS